MNKESVKESIKRHIPGLYKEFEAPTNPTQCPDIQKHGMIIYQIEDVFIAYCQCVPLKNNLRVMAYVPGDGQTDYESIAKKLPWKTTVHNHSLNYDEALCECEPE